MLVGTLDADARSGESRAQGHLCHQFLGLDIYMTNVFISYSHQEREFVKKLAPGFCKLNRKIWVNVENLPLRADWW
jgi:hypothetical protein